MSAEALAKAGVSFSISFFPTFIPSLYMFRSAFRSLFRWVFRWVFHPGNHVIFLEEAKKTKDGSRAPIPYTGKVSDTCTEFAAPESGGRIVDTSCQDIRQIEPSIKSGESLPFFLENRVRPGLPPEEGVAAIHSASLRICLKTN
jgi:hypothetical protein